MKAIRILKTTSEGKQYIKPIPVFVSVNPSYDTPEKLKRYRDDLFGPELLVLRETSHDAPNFKDILRKFKVPIGLNEEERKQMQELFEKDEDKPGFFASLMGAGEKKKSAMQAAEGVLGHNSKAIFLMAPDNKFLNFYRLDLTEKELANQIIEDVSYDIGNTHIGTKNMPDTVDSRFG